MAKKKKHRNVPQLLFNLVMAQINMLIWGRGTGKTTGAAADFIVDKVRQMPRSTGAIYCNTHTDILTKILPQIRLGLADHGLVEDLHYFIGKWAPKEWKWKKSFNAPIDPRNFITFVNGTGIHLISGDRGITNGLNIDWAIIDEARKQKLDRLKDFIPTLRGNADRWGHLSCYNSVLYMTDMPKYAKERWVLDYKKKMDKEVIDTILSVQIRLMQLRDLHKQEPKKQKWVDEIKKLKRRLNYLRKGTVYYSTASTLDNIHVLGVNAIYAMKEQLSKVDYMTSVLNEEILKIENGFYGSLDEDKHGYNAENYLHIDTLGHSNLKRDCLWHHDIQLDEALDLALDYNNAINCVVTGQQYDDEYRILSAHFVKPPQYLSDAVQQWCDYYFHHRHKYVNYYYDNTAIGNNAKGDIPFYQEVIRILRLNGWTVNENGYLGQASSHHSRFLLYSAILEERDKRLSKFRFNKVAAYQAYVSMAGAGVIRFGNTFKKDKSTETDGKTPPEDSTHMSEAVDTLIYASQRASFDGSPEYSGNVSA